MADTANVDYYYAPKLFKEAASPPPPENEDLKSPLPGFPLRYAGERVWTGAEMSAKEDEWTMVLSDEDHVHVVAALRHFQGLNLNPSHLSPETFPLPPELHDRLREISHDVYNGRGFGVLRGLRPDTFTDEENVLVYAGVSSHVAPTRGYQDLGRELVTCHVISEELSPGAGERDLRPAFTNGRLAFHTDVGDILSLYTMQGPESGGETMIASSSHLYNEIAQTRPDLLRELAKNWVSFSSQDYDTDGTPLVTNAPGDRLVFQYSRLPITGFRNKGANPTLPPPSRARLEAMTLIEELAWQNAMALPGRIGDVAYVNNQCLVHARRSFDLDTATGAPLPSRRHLVKLMLRDPALAWDLPDSLDWYTWRIYGPNREDGSRAETWQIKVGRNGSSSPADGAIWVRDGGASDGGGGGRGSPSPEPEPKPLANG